MDVGGGGVRCLEARRATPGYRWVFRTTYRHYRTGKIMRARDYGYKAWTFLAPYLVRLGKKAA